MGETIADLIWMEDAVEKSFTESFVRRLDARYFDDIDADAENHLTSVSFHQGEHFADGLSDPDENSATDDAVADIQLDQMGHAIEGAKVVIIQTVAGINFQAQ